MRDDAGFLTMPDARSSVFPSTLASVVVALPAARRAGSAERAAGVALLATGGSGALASVVGVARAFEDRGTRPSLISLCSGSALFGFPIAAGCRRPRSPTFTLGLRPRDYVDVDWRRLALLVPTSAAVSRASSAVTGSRPRTASCSAT